MKIRMRLVSALVSNVALVACGAASDGQLDASRYVDSTAVYLVEQHPEDSSVLQLEGAFRFDGAPRMSSATVHPLRSALRFSDFTGNVYEVELEVGRAAQPVELTTACPGKVDWSRHDAETGELVYSCFEGVNAPTVYRRGSEELPGCSGPPPPLVVAGNLVLCSNELLVRGDAVTIDGLIQYARRSGDRFLAVADVDRLISIDDAGAVTELHRFASPPDRHGERPVWFVGGDGALSAGGTWYRIGRLDDPNVGDQIVYAFDELGARPVSDSLPADARVRLVTGP